MLGRCRGVLGVGRGESIGEGKVASRWGSPAVSFSLAVERSGDALEHLSERLDVAFLLVVGDASQSQGGDESSSGSPCSTLLLRAEQTCEDLGSLLDDVLERWAADGRAPREDVEDEVEGGSLRVDFAGGEVLVDRVEETAASSDQHGYD